MTPTTSRYVLDAHHIRGLIGQTYWMCDIYDGPPRPDHHNYVDSTKAHSSAALALAAGEVLRRELEAGDAS